MEIAGAAAHEAGRGCHARRSRAAVTWGARRRRGCHVRCAASCDIASRRIVTPRSGIQIALLAVSPTFFSFPPRQKEDLCVTAGQKPRATTRHHEQTAKTCDGHHIARSGFRGFRRGSVSQERF